MYGSEMCQATYVRRIFVQLLAKGVKPADAARHARWLFLFFLLWGAFGVWVALRKIQQNADVLRYTATTQGEITLVKLTGKGAPAMRYAYDVMGTQYSGVTDPSVRRNYRQDPRVGDPIEVSFSTKHPNWSIAGDPKRQPDYGQTIALSWVFIVMGLIGLSGSQLVAARLKKAEPKQPAPASESRQQRRAFERKQRKLLR
jgi:hypothetical protein